MDVREGERDKNNNKEPLFLLLKTLVQEQGSTNTLMKLNKGSHCYGNLIYRGGSLTNKWKKERPLKKLVVEQLAIEREKVRSLPYTLHKNKFQLDSRP